MRKALAIGGGILAGVALLGVGVAVGSNVGQEEQIVVATSDAEGPLNQQDQLLIAEFSNISGSFDQLIVKVQKGKPVGEQITRNAVAALNVGRLANNEALKEAATATGDAMLLIGAGVTANDEQTTAEGVEAYQAAQEKIVELAQEVNPELTNEPTGDPSTAPESPDSETSGNTDSGGDTSGDSSTQE